MKTNKRSCVKSAKELELTSEQRKNLAKLVIFVNAKVPPPKFNIRLFNSDSHIYATDSVGCGTTACFCGYGPLAGIKVLQDEQWQEYANRIFNAGAWGNIKLYNFLFDFKHENSKKAAVLRGAYYLMHGFPKYQYSEELKEMEVPKNFKPNWHSIRAVASTK